MPDVADCAAPVDFYGPFPCAGPDWHGQGLVHTSGSDALAFPADPVCFHPRGRRVNLPRPTRPHPAGRVLVLLALTHPDRAPTAWHFPATGFGETDQAISGFGWMPTPDDPAGLAVPVPLHPAWTDDACVN